MATSSSNEEVVGTAQWKGESNVALKEIDASHDKLSDLRGEKDGRGGDAEKSSRNKHNIFGYVANSAIRIVMDKYKLKIMRLGKGNDFTYKEF